MLIPSSLLSSFVLTFLCAAPPAPQDPTPLLAGLRSADADERAAAAQALERIGPAALRSLRALRDETRDADLKVRVEHVIGGIELSYPGGLMLAFCRGEAVRNELWLWRDGDTFALTANTTMEADVALSPDGRHVAFSRTPDHHDFGVHELLVVELATGTTVMTDKSYAARWSPDGTLLAIPRKDMLVLRRLDGSGERRVGADLGEVREVQWSPNGRFLAAETKDGIAVLDAASGARHALVDGTPPDTSSLYNFSLGDSLVSMVCGNGPYEWDVYVAALDGEAARKLTTQSFRHGMTSLAPDASCLLSLQSAPVRAGDGEGAGEADPGPRRPGHGGNGYAAYLLDIATGAQREVFASANPLLQPQWSPEGRFVVFVDGAGMLQLLHVRSGRTRALTTMEVGYGPSTTSFAPSVWFANGRDLPEVKRPAIERPAAK